MAPSSSLAFTRQEQIITVKVPEKALDPIDTVIVLEITGEPELVGESN